MRRLAGCLCHGRARRAREPLGLAAPLLRLLAWALVALGSALVLLMAAAYALSAPRDVVTGLGLAGYGGLLLAPVLRLFAAVSRPLDVTPLVVTTAPHS